MNGRRVAGLALVVVGIIVIVAGGVFWTDRDTIVDAGPLQVQTEEREGLALPPLLGAALIVGGIVLLAMPARRRV